VRFDLSFVHVARALAEETRLRLDAEMDALTGHAVTKASKVQELKRYLVRQGVDLSPPPELKREGEVIADEPAADDVEDPQECEEEEKPLPDMRRRDVVRLLADPRVHDREKAVLQIRLEAGKISTRKLDAIAERSDADGVVRGLHGYHGANTGRYISHGVQIHNFPRVTVEDWDGIRHTLDHGAGLVEALAGPPLDVLSKMLRGSIIPRPGHDIASGDFTSVEAVGVAWLAGEAELLEGFRRKAKMYEDMAGRVFDMPAAAVGPDSWQRQVGKTLVLGAGYQMGWRKFRETVLLMGGILLEPEVAERAVAVYRETFPRIPRLWRGLQSAAIAAVKTPGSITTVKLGGEAATVAFLCQGKWLRMKLPSGRYLWYAQPLVETGQYEQETVTYMGVNPKTKRWERGQTYGGRLTENAVQGLCRDLLVTATIALEEQDYRPIALVHDEVICEPRVGFGSIEEQLEIMCELPAWAAGFPLSAKGRRGPRYVK
jgi:DNA polymerase